MEILLRKEIRIAGQPLGGTQLQHVIIPNFCILQVNNLN